MSYTAWLPTSGSGVLLFVHFARSPWKVMESEGFSISIDRALGTCAGASALQLGITVAAIVPTVDVCDAVFP